MRINKITFGRIVLILFVIVSIGIVYAAITKPTSDPSEITDNLIVDENPDLSTREVEIQTIPQGISLSSLEYGPTTTIIPYKEESAKNISEEYLSEKEDYAIIYYSDSNLYSIVILNSPVEKIQSKAENELLSILGISRPEACKLNVVIKHPRFVSDDTTIESLSFCK